jgi:hypothetical protein
MLPALRAVHPNHSWDVWRFNQISVPASQALLRSDNAPWTRFAEQISQILHLSSLEDWYRVSRPQLQSDNRIKMSLIRRAGGLYPMLCRAYPTHSWDPSRFGTAGKTTGAYVRGLKAQLKIIYPKHQVIENQVESLDDNSRLEIDLYAKIFGASPCSGPCGISYPSTLYFLLF